MAKMKKTLRKGTSRQKAAHRKAHPRTAAAPVISPPAQAQPSEPAVEQAVQGTEEPIKIRASTATGNEKIEILKHAFFDVREDNRGVLLPAGVDLAVRNLVESTIATAIIEVLFYDIEGNVVDSAKHTAIELWPDTSRGIRIESQVMELDKIKSYDIRITTTRTAEQERVQLRCHDINHNAAGEDVVEGVVKNISRVKADAAVVIAFFGANNVDIGRKVIVLRDIEPETTRHYTLRFKAPEGERMGTYSIDIAEIA